MSPDRRAADRLNDYLDAVATGTAPSRDLDLALGATVECFFAADDAPAPPPELADRLWERLMDAPASAELTPHPPVVLPDRNGRAPAHVAPSPTTIGLSASGRLQPSPTRTRARDRG